MPASGIHFAKYCPAARFGQKAVSFTVRRILAGLVLLLALGSAAWAKDAISIGYLSLKDDPRYSQDWGYARVVLPPPIRTMDGAQLALDDLSFTADAVGLSFTLDARQGDDVAGLTDALKRMVDEGTRFVVLDLPAEMVQELAKTARDWPVELINATAGDDALRTACYAELLHSGASDRMAADSLVQYLRARDWTKILVLIGENPRDAMLAQAFVTSAQRMRLQIVDQRVFTLAADPEHREENNIRLLTGGTDYDAVYVADTRGEFARYIPYQTALPRPVVGSVGLSAEEWHWAYERNGATQVSYRFDKRAGRKMSAADWSVWIAVKSVVTGYIKTPSHVLSDIVSFMTSDQMRLDGSKGVTMSYRDWDGQLRQPMLLATSDAVIAVAPLEGYLHKDNTLDTLGTDRAEFKCK